MCLFCGIFYQNNKKDANNPGNWKHYVSDYEYTSLMAMGIFRSHLAVMLVILFCNECLFNTVFCQKNERK